MMDHFKLALVGITLIVIQFIGILFPSIFMIINPVYLWVALCTIGIPCLLVSLAFRIFRISKFVINKNKLRVTLVISLIVATIPATNIFVELWLSFKPSDGPAIGYIGMFYINTAHIWIPLLILIALYVTKMPNKHLKRDC